MNNKQDDKLYDIILVSFASGFMLACIYCTIIYGLALG